MQWPSINKLSIWMIDSCLLLRHRFLQKMRTIQRQRSTEILLLSRLCCQHRFCWTSFCRENIILFFQCISENTLFFTECSRPVGFQDYQVPNNAMTASSVNVSEDCGSSDHPYYARLHRQALVNKYGLKLGDAWIPAVHNHSQWLQVRKKTRLSFKVFICKHAI